MAFLTGRAGEVIGALDIGSHKIVCLILELPADRRDATALPRVLGVGHNRSAGLKSGVVTSPRDAEAAIRDAVARAENAAGLTIESVYATMTCGRLGSRSFSAHAGISGSSVTGSDVSRLFDDARAFVERDGRALVHMNRKAFLLDGAPAGEDPRGLAAARLTAVMHAVTADEGPMRNLLHVVESCHLQAEGVIAAPYASALAVTTPEERKFGVTVIDMGAGTTSWAAFADGDFVSCEVLATGGHHLTIDIAQNLRAPLAEAERIKALYASVVNAQSDVADRFSYAPAEAGDGDTRVATRAALSGCVASRIDGLLETIAARLAAVGLARGPVVLTGGASQLVGLTAFAAGRFEGGVRLGRPAVLPGFEAAGHNPAFAAAVGLGLVVLRSSGGVLDGSGRSPGGYLSRVGRWIGGGL